jgi:hypothetical protein
MMFYVDLWRNFRVHNAGSLLDTHTFSSPYRAERDSNISSSGLS